MKNEILVETDIIKVNTKKKIEDLFYQNPGAYMVKMYDKKAREVRERIEEREEDNNIRYYRDIAVKVEGKMVLRSINKMIREVDVVSE